MEGWTDDFMESKQKNFSLAAHFSQTSGSSVMVGRFGVVGPLRPSPRTLRLEMDQTSLSSAQNRWRRVERKTRVGLFRRQQSWKVTPLQGGMQGRGKFLSHWEHVPWWIFREKRVPANTVNFRWIYETESDAAHSKARVCMRAMGIILTPQNMRWQFCLFFVSW